MEAIALDPGWMGSVSGGGFHHFLLAILGADGALLRLAIVVI